MLSSSFIILKEIGPGHLRPPGYAQGTLWCRCLRLYQVGSDVIFCPVQNHIAEEADTKQDVVQGMFFCPWKSRVARGSGQRDLEFVN